MCVCVSVCTVQRIENMTVNMFVGLLLRYLSIIREYFRLRISVYPVNVNGKPEIDSGFELRTSDTILSLLDTLLFGDICEDAAAWRSGSLMKIKVRCSTVEREYVVSHSQPTILLCLRNKMAGWLRDLQ